MTRVTKAQLSRLVEAIGRKRTIDSESRALESEIKNLRKIAYDDLRSTGNPTAKRSGFLLRWSTAKGRVAWKEEFIREVGSEKATQLAENVGTVQSIDVVPAEVA
ncbi:hypothetical protein [Rosistilla oblonga]|uniref:Uncharacterized protein n=1 Tax=Rosistilla oblonga TaxID=2527990 RepID=A0A518ITT8_9BACT|nr:hypothetical protein [Rosistilla oblonga]QDV56501.1 hypothetical protein Mal33_24920 [Rosistilla oblonga]